MIHPSGSTAPSIASRGMRDDDDFRRVRSFLVRTHAITPPGLNWDVRRWDGRRFYTDDPVWDPTWSDRYRLWLSPDGQVLGAAHPEGRGDVHLQVHPDHRALEPAMLAWAERHLAMPPKAGGPPQLTTYVFDYDVQRQALLRQRGFRRLDEGGATRRLRLGRQPLATPALADGYAIRTVEPEDREDCQRIADVLNAAFGRTFHVADEFRVFTEHAPSYRSDLDLVAVAPDGSFAAYAGVPYDPDNRYGMFEPVCTHPDHRRLGLALALMLEGLQRLRSIGARRVGVDTGDMVPANRLYDAVGFTECYRCHAWRKVLS